MFEQAFKNIDAAIWKDTGCDSELDYAEQSSWILFLKWLDDFEKDEETKAKLDNKKFNPIFKTEYRWSSWAVVKDKKGKVDFNKTLTGSDLIKFVNNKLFPYLSSFKKKRIILIQLNIKLELFFQS